VISSRDWLFSYDSSPEFKGQDIQVYLGDQPLTGVTGVDITYGSTPPGDDKYVVTARRADTLYSQVVRKRLGL
jgi:hypothetical protein